MARNRVIYAIVGLIIILSAFGIVSFIINKLIGATSGDFGGGGGGELSPFAESPLGAVASQSISYGPSFGY